MPDEFIVITMLKVIVKFESIEANYAGGWARFADRYELDGDAKPRLVPLTSMNHEDLNATVDELTADGLTTGVDFAVADSRRGALEPCAGIAIEERKFGRPPRESIEWIAYS